MRQELDAVVIGAGPAGLAASRELALRGVRHALLERGEAVGWSWRRAYDSLTLHTGKHLSALPGLSFGRRTPLFVSRDAFVAYLERYAERFRLPLTTGCEALSAAHGADGWTLETTQGGLQARSLVLATGIMSNPVRPRPIGEERFGGRVLHSVEYRRPEPFAGHRVLVVGAGNSAGEIASELAASGVEVTLSVRSGANVVPRSLLGIPIQYLALVVRTLPRPLSQALVGAVRRLTELRRGPPPLPRPAVGPLDSIPLIGFGLVDAIRAGRVTVRGALSELTATGARFQDGSETQLDDVVFATGYRAAVGVLRGAAPLDERGFVRRRARVIAEDVPELYVVGHNYDAGGGLYNIRRDAPLAARRIARVVHPSHGVPA